MPETTIKLAMAQMRVEGGHRRENLRRAERVIHAAAAQDAQIVVLPECLDLGWTHCSARELAEPIPGVASDLLARAAVEAGDLLHGRLDVDGEAPART